MPSIEWRKQAIEFYKELIITPTISNANYIRRLESVFDLAPVRKEDLSESLYISLFGGRNADYYSDLWLVQRNSSSEIFYKHHALDFNQPILIVFGETPEPFFVPFFSNDDLLLDYLLIDQGIDPIELDNLEGIRCRQYTNALHSMITRLERLGVDSSSIELPGRIIDREKYLPHKEIIVL